MLQYCITTTQYVKMNAPKNESARSAFIVLTEEKRKRDTYQKWSI